VLTIRSADEYVATAGYAFPDIPLAIVADFGLVNFNNKEFDTEYSKTNTAYGYEIVGGLKAWLPESLLLKTVGSTTFTPYAKVGHTLFTKYMFEEKGDRTGLKIKNKADNHTAEGFKIHAGSKIAVNSKFGIIAEYFYAQQVMRGKVKTEISGITNGPNIEEKTNTNARFNSHGVLVGAEMSL
jgi:opacity protein-like surface antigen